MVDFGTAFGTNFLQQDPRLGLLAALGQQSSVPTPTQVNMQPVAAPQSPMQAPMGISPPAAAPAAQMAPQGAQQDQQRQYLLNGRFGDTLRNNQGSIFNLAAGLLGGRQGLQQALANMPQAMQGDRANADRQRQNMALQQYLGTQAMSPEKKALLSAFPQLAAEQAFGGPDQTTTMKEYDLAKEQGFGGSFLDYITSVKRAGAASTNVNVGGKYGTIPPGYALKENPDGTVSMDVVPGSPADREMQAADKGAITAARTSALQAHVALDAINSIWGIEKSVGDPSTLSGDKSIGLREYSDSPQGMVKSYIDTLQSPTVLNALQALKEASPTGSSGFGALNKAELQTLIDQLGKLDQTNTSWEVLRKTFKNIETRWNFVIDDIRRNVPPKKIKEYGLEPLLQSGSQGATVGDKNSDGIIDWRDI